MLQRKVYSAAKMILFVVSSVLLLVRASVADFIDEYEAELLVAATDGIYRTSLNGIDTILIAKAVNATSVDYHFDKRLLFWSDVGTHRIYCKDLFNDSSEIKTVVAGSNNWEPRAIAVDSVNDKIYVMDQGGRKIDVFELDGSKRVYGIQVNLTEPDVDEDDSLDVGPTTMDIVVDPYEGLVFYGDHNKVMRATMDFSSVECVGQKSRISGLAIDPYIKSFYYADTQQFLWQTNYEGERKNSVNVYEDSSGYLQGTTLTPRSLSKYRNFRQGFFWLEDRKDGYPGINYLWRFQGHFLSDSVYTEMKSAWAIRVRHRTWLGRRTLRVKDYAKGCEKADCEYMCLVSNIKYSSVSHSCFEEA